MLVSIYRIVFLMLFIKYIYAAETEATQENTTKNPFYQKPEDYCLHIQSDYIKTRKNGHRTILAYDEFLILKKFNAQFCENNKITQNKIFKLQEKALNRSLKQFSDILNDIIEKIEVFSILDHDINATLSAFMTSSINFSAMMSKIINLIEELSELICWLENEVKSESDKFFFYLQAKFKTLKNMLFSLLIRHNSFYVNNKNNLRIVAKNEKIVVCWLFFTINKNEMLDNIDSYVDLKKNGYNIVFDSIDESLFYFDNKHSKIHVTKKNIIIGDIGKYKLNIKLKLKLKNHKNIVEYTGHLAFIGFLQFINEFLNYCNEIQKQILILSQIDPDFIYENEIFYLFDIESTDEKYNYYLCSTFSYQLEKLFFLNLLTISGSLSKSIRYASSNKNTMKLNVMKAIKKIFMIFEVDMKETFSEKYNLALVAFYKCNTVKIRLIKDLLEYLKKKLFEANKIKYTYKNIKIAILEHNTLKETINIFTRLNFSIISEEISNKIYAFIEIENKKIGNNW